MKQSKNHVGKPILNVEGSEITIDMSEYVTGAYIVSLICNGQLVDSKNLIKE